MRKAHTATGALALVLALTLAGCANDSPDPASASGAPTASAEAATEQDPTANESAVETTDDAMDKDDSEAMDTASDAMASEGAWIDQATYEADLASYHAAGDVVLFFNATWCPTCQAAVKSLDADGTPAGLTVVRVDYDDNTELKKKYGVTYQHTFVQVDESGSELTKFTGSRTGAEIASNTV
jgi:thioredoxin 1